MTAAAIPYVVAAVGTAAKLRGDKIAGDQRRSDLNHAMQRTNKTQDDASAKIVQESQSLAPTARQQAMDTQAATNVAQSTGDLKGAAALDANGNAVIDTAGDRGNVSQDFMTAKADRALSEGQRLSSLASAMAKTRAPGQVATDEAQRRAALTGDLNSTWSSTRNLNQADTLKAQERQAPLWGQLGGLAAQAALAYLTAGAGNAAMAGAGMGQTSAGTLNGAGQATRIFA